MDANLISAWNALVLQFFFVFTQPTAITWQQIVLGWILRRGPATVTNIIRSLGTLATKHWTVYEKFFYRSAWLLEELSCILLQKVILPMIIESGVFDNQTGKPVVDMAIDDTTAARYGKHVAHAGWFKDASATGPAHKGQVIHWAHNWIVGVITLRLPRWGLIRWALPAVFALYRKVQDCDDEHPFRKRQTLAAAMVRQTAEALPGVKLRVSADGQYATRDMVVGLPEGVDFVGRIRCDAALYALPPKRRPRHKPGRKPNKGKRLPPPKMLARRKKGWKTICVYRQGHMVIRQVLGITCLWYHVCRDNPIRLVIVRDPSGRETDDFFFCTNPNVSDVEIVQRYYDRWGVEETILESKQYLGFETTRGWCSKTVNRQAPLAMVLNTLVKAWYARCALKTPSLLPKAPPWYKHKQHPSFSDMLSSLREVLWRHRISTNSGFRGKVAKIIKTISYALSAA